MKKIRLGIIGTGIAARTLHLPALNKLKHKFEITAVSNHTEKKAKSFSKLVGGVPYYLNYMDLLKRDDIDAVDFLLPIDINYKAIKDAIKFNKHIICEKPLASNLDQGRKLLAAEKDYGKTIMIAENFRYRKVYEKTKSLLEKGVVGKPYTVIWNVFYNITSKNEYAAKKWRRQHKYPGGFMSDAGVHNIAAIRYLFGEINSVSAFTKSVNPKIGTPDTMSIQFEMQTGVSGLYNLFFSVQDNWLDQLLIFGSQGTLEILMDKVIVKKEGRKRREYDCKDDHGYKKEFEDFYNAVINGSRPAGSVLEAYKDLEVIIKALQSSEKMKRIAVKSD